MDLVEKERLVARELEDARHLFAFDLSRYSTHVRACLAVIHASVFDPALNVGYVYDEAGISSNSLGTRFRQEVEVSMREYIENARMLAAMRLLGHDEIELHLIATAVGYTHYETFSRAFKRRVGHAPSTYRDLYTENVIPTTRKNIGGREGHPALPFRSRGSTQRPSPLSTRISSGTSPHHPPLSIKAGAIMQITDVRGIPSDDLSLDSIEVEGRAPDADKVEVTLEVTGKQLSKTISVRKDETWTARFKESSKTDLAGFACGALVTAAAIASGDDTQRVSWKGCLPCSSGNGASEADDSDEDDTSGASTEQRSTSGERRGESEPLLVVERRADAESGDALLTVRVAESSDAIAYRRSEDNYDDRRRREDQPQERRDRDWREREQRERGPGTLASAPPDDRPDETRLAPHPDDQDHAARQRDNRKREDRRRENRRRDDRQREEEDGTPVWLGGLLALAEAGFLVAVAAQSYPLIVGGAAAFLLAMTAFFFASEPPRSWATWTLGGLGLAAVALAGMFPFFEFVKMDVYLLAAGIAAAGLAGGAAFLMFSSDDEDESDDA